MHDQRTTLAGSVPAHDHPPVGPADPAERIEVTVKLRRATEEGLPTLDEFLDGKRSKGITRRDLRDRYGATPESAEAVQKWASTQGLSVSRIELGSRQLRLVGTTAAMARAFATRLSMYRHARTGVLFRCPTGDIQIPTSLAGIVTGVFGLNDMPVVRRHSVRVGRKVAAADPKASWPGSFYPNEVARLYNFPPQQGSGQKVAVLEFGGGFDQTVLADYFTHQIELETPPTVNAISVLNTPIKVDPDVTGEVYLDIEVIGAMAPKATIDVYFAPWTGQGYLAAIEQAIRNDDYAAISISYGLDEDQRGSASFAGWPALSAHIDEAFRDANALGIPVFVSTGDQGSSSVRGQQQGQEVTGYDEMAHAGYPASSPYATAVGGTLLYEKASAIDQEVVWNELGPLLQDKFYVGGATGGGVSDRYPKVPSYQTSAGVVPKSANGSGAPGRGIPDVAGNAGASTGYLVSQPPGSPYAIAPVGGTSASAPMWAALMACVREGLETAFDGKVPNYFLNDFVYARGKSAAFRDIVGGRNFTLDANGNLVPGAFIPVGNNRSASVAGYSAGTGYDQCTGWGSPNGAALLAELGTWLKAQPVPTP